MSPADLCEIRPKLPQKSPTGLSTQGPGPPSFPASWTLSARFRRGLWGRGGGGGIWAPLRPSGSQTLGLWGAPLPPHAHTAYSPHIPSYSASCAQRRRRGGWGVRVPQNGGVCTPCLLGRAAFRVPAGPAAAPRRHRSQVTLRPTQLSRVWRGGRGGQRQRFSRTLGAGTPGMRPARSLRLWAPPGTRVLRPPRLSSGAELRAAETFKSPPRDGGVEEAGKAAAAAGRGLGPGRRAGVGEREGTHQRVLSWKCSSTA